MNRIIALLFGILLSATAMGASADMPEPDVLIRNTVNDVLEIVKTDKDIQAGNQQKILALVDAKILPHFDFERMTRLAVGRGWRSATPEQRQELVNQFRTLLVRTYTSAFTRYKDQTVKIEPLRMQSGDDEVTVALDDGERGVTLIEMTHLRGDPQRLEEPPASDTEDDLLLQAQLRPAAVELAGDPAVWRKVCRLP